MKTAIFYICTGTYSVFWKDFYESFEKLFLPNHQKHYFVFTDNLSLDVGPNVTIIEKKCEGFPADSLFRFDMFLKVEREVSHYDYVFFMNSNMLCVAPVDSSILPTKEEGYLVFVESLGYKKRNPRIFPYERDRQSLAYIPRVKNYTYRYVLGGVNGGRVKEYYDFVKLLSSHIREDYDHHVMAIFHDESHINRYFFDHPYCKCLPYTYALAEGVNAPDSPKIIIRDKTKVHATFNHRYGIGLLGRLTLFSKRVFRYIFW